MGWFSLTYFAAFLVIVFIWAQVHSQNSTDSLNRAFILLVAYCGVFVFLELIVQLPGMAGLEEIVIKSTEIVWIPLGYIYLHFVYRLLGKKPNWPYALFAILAGLSVIYSQLPMHYNVVVAQQRWAVAPNPSTLNFNVSSFAPGLAAFFGMGLIGFAIRSESEQGLSSGPLKLIFAASSFALISLVTQNVLIPLFAPAASIPRFAAPSLAIFLTVCYLALQKQHLFLWNSEQIAASLFDNVDEGIALIDKQGAIRQLNSAMSRILGLKSDSLGRRLASTLIPGLEMDDDNLEQEIELRLKESTRTYNLSKTSYTRRGVPVGHLIFLNDISRDKKNEAFLQMSQDKMEREVARRTDEFFQMQKMAAIGTLAPGIVHDFNNILASIIGFSSAAKDDLPADHPVHDDLNEVLGASFRARDIVSQIPTSNKGQEQEATVVKAARVVDEVLTQIAVSLPSSITVTKDIRVQTGFILAKSTHFHQIVMNLCTNAHQAMRRNGGQMTVLLEEVRLDKQFTKKHPPLEPGMHITLTIADTGKGMDSQTLAKVFEPFFTTKKTGEGTGLGLSLVHRLVTHLGGVVKIKSEVGAGSSFTVYLPSIVREPWQSLAPTKEVEGGNERIMVVDDDLQVGRAIKRMLSSLGYKIVVFNNPLEALKSHVQNPTEFDLVITDQSMPEMTGIELAGKLLEINKSLPILLVSGATKIDELKVKAQNTGVRDSLPKPVLKETLAEAVRKQLDQ